MMLGPTYSGGEVVWLKPFMVLEGRKQRNGVSKNANPKDCLAKEMEKMKGDGNGNSCCGENLLEFEGRKRWGFLFLMPCLVAKFIDFLRNFVFGVY